METIAVGCREEVDFGLEPEAKAGLCLPVVCCFLAASIQQTSRHVLLSVEDKYLMKVCAIMRWCSDQISVAAYLSIDIWLSSSILWTCDLPIPFFAESDFLSKNYNWQHIQTKIYANFNKKYFYIIKYIIKHYNSPNLDWVTDFLSLKQLKIKLIILIHLK